MRRRRIEIYDTTLRDGSQSEDVSFTVADKLKLARELDRFGVDFIEGGWPGSNPKDEEFFRQVGGLKLTHAKVMAFGSTCRAKIAAAKDSQLRALIDSQADGVCIFGKSWDLHVREALKTSKKENLRMIHDSVAHLVRHFAEVIYDAEHFFDGFRSHPEYALATLQAAYAGGARLVVLCDTNGGTMPQEMAAIFAAIRPALKKFGIHCHNDCELAVANSLLALENGASQVQGTINGMGERCGNANLTAILPNMVLKMGFDCRAAQHLGSLTELSRLVDELANRSHHRHQAYVGDAAFAHKGGVHVNAILKNRLTYEHIDPALVGNRQRVLISDLSGAANILHKVREFGLNLDPQDPRVRDPRVRDPRVRDPRVRDPRVKKLLTTLKNFEAQGFQYEGAEASFEILVKKTLGHYRPHFNLVSLRVVDDLRPGVHTPTSEAGIELAVDGTRRHCVARGLGPVHALDQALRGALGHFYPQLAALSLSDYKVRVLSTGAGTAAVVRVLIESTDGHRSWGTVGVSENIIEASYHALVDSIDYKLMQDER